MANPNSPITIAGNLADDPELRFTPNGTAVANLRVAVNDSYYDRQKGEWKEVLRGFFTVNVWRDQAESVAQYLKKGHRVIVRGILRNRSYETQDGQTRWVTEIEADEIGKSLLFVRVTENGSGGSGKPQSRRGSSQRSENRQRNSQQEPEQAPLPKDVPY